MAQLTLAQAKVVLAQHGIAAMTKADYDQLCEQAAAGILARADIDRDFAALFGPTTG